MTKEHFFEKQRDLTASKILFFERYVENYLPKILMQYGKCYIADLFCGPGKNGDKDGSPLVLLRRIIKTLESPVIRSKRPDAEISILFNDNNKTAIEDLSEAVSALGLPKNVKVVTVCNKFKEIIRDIGAVLRDKQEPKFFFLDPFGYSDIGVDDIKLLMAFPNTEVLLFLPTFHTYRFHKDPGSPLATKSFVQSFTDKGLVDYESIDDFNESIRWKLRSYLGLEFVRAIKLDKGACKNALFYMTRHTVGMLLMNNLVWKYSIDGSKVCPGQTGDQALFDLSSCSQNFVDKKNLLIEHVRKERQLSNVEVIKFVAINGFTTAYARETLTEMKKNEKIEVKYLRPDKIKGLYIADNNWNDSLSIIKYIG